LLWIILQQNDTSLNGFENNGVNSVGADLPNFKPVRNSDIARRIGGRPIA